MSCTLYKWVHIPAQPDSPDHHHVIPRAWMKFWQPPSAAQPLRSNPGLVFTPDLWDPRTVEVCPNCHRRIHEALVRMMKGKPKRRRDAASKVAQQGMDRFVAAGGSLDALRAAGLFGEQ